MVRVRSIPRDGPAAGRARTMGPPKPWRRRGRPGPERGRRVTRIAESPRPGSLESERWASVGEGFIGKNGEAASVHATGRKSPTIGMIRIAGSTFKRDVRPNPSPSAAANRDKLQAGLSGLAISARRIPDRRVHRLGSTTAGAGAAQVDLPVPPLMHALFRLAFEPEESFIYHRVLRPWIV